MKPTISIASFSFVSLFNKQAFSVFQYLETVRYRYQLNTADIWNMMLASYDDEYLKLVKQQMDERDITLVNLCVDGATMWTQNESDKQQNDQMVENCLKAAQILGAKTIRMDLGIHEAVATDEQIEFCAARIDKICKRVSHFGAKFGPENHWGASTNITELRKLFQAVKADNFGMLLHVGRWTETANVTPELRDAYDQEMIRHAFHTHLDYSTCMEAEKRFPFIKESGYQGSWSVETSLNEIDFLLAQVRRFIRPVSAD